jgi:hypothetical protein
MQLFQLKASKVFMPQSCIALSNHTGKPVANVLLAWQSHLPADTLPYAHQDIPWNEPALMAAMLLPRWPER